MAKPKSAPPPPPYPAAGPAQVANHSYHSVTRIVLNADPRTPFDPTHSHATAAEGYVGGGLTPNGHAWGGPIEFRPGVGGAANLKAIITFNCTTYHVHGANCALVAAAGSGTMVITLEGNNPPVTPVAVDFVDDPT